MSNSIKSLSPAAARLLLAFLSTAPDESYDEAITRSGICRCQTLIQAKQSLFDAGYLLYDSAGMEHLNFQRSE